MVSWGLFDMKWLHRTIPVLLQMTGCHQSWQRRKLPYILVVFFFFNALELKSQQTLSFYHIYS